jgi:hypothetical protein
LNGFEKGLETNYSSISGSMSTSHNVDSSVMLSNIQDSMHGSEKEADGHIPPITYQRKIHDSIEAFLGTTSMSEFEKMPLHFTILHFPSAITSTVLYL